MNQLKTVLSALLLCVFSGSLLHAEDNRREIEPNRRELLVRQALHAQSELKEFRDLYPESYFRLIHEHGRWLAQGIVLLTPDYEFKVELPVQVPRYTGNLRPLGGSEFTLRKIREISLNTRGELEVDHGLPIVQFRVTRWLQLYNADGDFNAINVRLEGGPALPERHRYLEQLRKQADYP